MTFNGETNFEDLLEGYLVEEEQGRNAYVKQGVVVHVGADSVLVDVGMKSEGVIPLKEFQNLAGEVTIQPGDVIDVLVTKKANSSAFSLSYAKVKDRRAFEKLEKSMEEGEVFKAHILKKIKGGYLTEIEGVRAFLPGSHVGVYHNDPEELIGKTLDVMIIKVHRKRNNVIVSHKIVIDKKREALKQNCLEMLQEGAVMAGVVKTITEYGAFVDLGGIDGLLHMVDLSWKRVKNVRDVLELGDEITVKVLSFNPETQKLSLGLKQLTEDPWSTVEERFPVGSRYDAKVVSIVDYGVFVALDEYIEGLVHISEMSWTRKLRHPQQMVNVGDIVEVVVLDVDKDKRRIALGMKQVKENPWDIVEQMFPVGTILESTIKNITDFGIFVAIEDGIDGLIHISDISWVNKIQNLKELYSVGDIIQAQVTLIDKENEKFTLSIKELERNPWEVVAEKYRVGSILQGVISNITDFGIFVKIEEGIEGLVHISEVDEEKANALRDNFATGDAVEVQIIHLAVSEKERKLGLSMKRCDPNRAYQDSADTYNTTLGDMFADKFRR